MTENDKRPSLEELRTIVNSKPVLTGEFNLTPSVDRAIPVRKMYEDSDFFLKDQADEAFTDELMRHPETATKRDRLRFIRSTLKYDNRILAQYLGITTDQVQRYDLRGRRKTEIERFEQRFNGLFTLSSILERHFKDYIGAVIDRKVVLNTPNGKLSDVSISKALQGGYVNIAVAIILETLRQNGETIGYQEEVNEPFS